MICLIVVCMSIAVSSCSLLVRLLPLPNRDESDRRSLSLLSSFISVVVLLLARGASPAGRSSLRQTSDDDDTTTNRTSPSHSVVVVIAQCWRAMRDDNAAQWLLRESGRQAVSQI